MFRISRPSHRSCSSSNSDPLTIKSVVDSLKEENVGRRISLNGWVKTARIQKVNTFLDIVDGLSNARLQVVIPTKDLKENGIVRYRMIFKIRYQNFYHLGIGREKF